MADEMGLLRTDVEIESHHQPWKRALLHQVRFQQAGAADTVTVDEVVFGEPNDLVLLGARTLEGMNLKVDLVGKRLVSAGPVMAAVAA